MVNSAHVYAWFGITPSISARTDLVTSPLFSPLILACIRLLFGCYGLVTAITVLAYDSSLASTNNAGGYFSYFTELSYIGLVSYFIASGVQTFCYALNIRKGQQPASYPLQNWPRLLQFLHRLLLSSIVTFPIIVTAVFWALLSGGGTFGDRFSAWSNISQHALNTPFAVFEIIFTHAWPSWIHLPFLIVILGGYLGVAYITYANEGFYTYQFLDPKTEHGLLAAYVVGIAVGECVIFALVYGICYLRERISAKLQRGRDDGELGQPEEIDEWEEVESPHLPSMAQV